MNPIISMMNRQNPMMAMIQPVYNVMKAAQNPMAGLQQMAMQDPRMQNVMDTIRQNGGIQQAVYAEAQRRNLNPNDVLNQAKQMMAGLNM